jgi:hypothetical protein
MMLTKLTLDRLLRKLSKIEIDRGAEQVTSGLLQRKLTLDQLESVVGGLRSSHTCGACSNGVEDDCGGSTE